MFPLGPLLIFGTGSSLAGLGAMIGLGVQGIGAALATLFASMLG
jgi:hypothetical protein